MVADGHGALGILDVLLEGFPALNVDVRARDHCDSVGLERGDDLYLRAAVDAGEHRGEGVGREVEVSLREERRGLRAALRHDDFEARDLLAVVVEVELLLRDDGLEPHAVILELLALRHRDHEGLLMRRHRVARADDGDVIREDRGGEGRRKNCQNKRK